MLHGASSTSNTGARWQWKLDLGTETSFVPRTAPIKVPEHTAAYGDEHNDRAGRARASLQCDVQSAAPR